MATVGGSVLTLTDWAKRIDPDGRIAVIAELLEQICDEVKDIKWLEGNLPTGHRSTVRTGLPTVFWRLLNQGTAPSKSTTAQVTEAVGILDAWSEVDKDLAELNGDLNAFRFSEAKAFIEAMTQEFSGTLWYGNSGTAPEEFHGLAPRYSAKSGATNGQNVILGGGSGSDNSSIWLIGHGENTFHGIFPKGSPAGLQHENLGLVTVETTAGVAGSRMRAYQDHFIWKVGVVLKDWRYVARICNIDISALVAKSSAADLFDLMIKATHVIPNLSSCSPVFYMNRTCFQMLDIQGRDDVQTGGQLSYESVAGRRIPMFRGIPIRISDQLLETEATIS